MKKYINKIVNGDCIEAMKTFPDNSIDSIVTSPPYFNLRNYNVEGQIGIEKTWREYVDKLINVFGEAKRILKDGGTCFINLGDSYSSGGNTRSQMISKCLMMIPERFAIAMIDNEWILRNKLVWIKPNAMPESVQDRWKKAHEYIFFFVKNKKYYFNLDSIRTKHKQVSIERAKYELGRNAMGLNTSSMGEKYNRDKEHKDGTEKYYSMPARHVKLNPKGAVPPDYFLVNTNCSENDVVKGHYATFPQSLISPLILAGCPKGGIVLDMFNGGGTTCLVAKKLSRNFIGIDISQEYCDMAIQRLRITQPLF